MTPVPGYFCDGSTTRPMNSNKPVFLSTIINKNGRSTRNAVAGSGIAPLVIITTAVAAAASVPFSSTLTNALCTTDEIYKRLVASVGAAIPANFGALEASNAAVVAALGLGGGGSLALTRRVRALLWAGLGLALYPRIKATG